MRPTHRGLLTDFLSTSSQRDAEKQLSNEDIAGALRLDIFLFGRLMVPDSHVFDGCLLLEKFSPLELVEICGHSAEKPTIEIRLRAPTFDRSLFDYIADRDTQRLRPIEYRFLRDSQLEEHVANTLSSGVAFSATEPPVKTLAAAMQDSGASLERVTALVEGWKRWEVDGPASVFKSWGNNPFELAAAMEESPLPRRVLDTDTGKEAYQRVLQTVLLGDTRSASADKTLRSYGDIANGAIKRDLDVVRQWYHDCRQAAIGRQHECAVATSTSHLSYLAPAILEYRGSSTIDIRADQTEAVYRLVYVLSDLTGDEFRHLMAETTPQRRAWLTLRNRKSLTNLVRAGVSTLALSPSAARGGQRMQQRVILPAVVKAIADFASHGSTLVADVLTLGLTSAGTQAKQLLSEGDVRAVVRWAQSATKAG